MVAGWGIPTLLRGADGAQGPTGPAGADGTIIYSGDYNPAPSLGKIGDFYFGRLVVTMFGPKTALGWGTGVNLRGATGNNGTNGTDGTNGTSILNGTGGPLTATGNNGDFYIDITTYTIYGPKAAGFWPQLGTSLKGTNGTNGNANVIALETPDNATFDWTLTNRTLQKYFLRKTGLTTNDTTTTYNIPAANFNAVKQGILLVYVRKNLGGGNYQWQQLNFTETAFGVNLNYAYSLKITPTNASVQIYYSDPFVTHLPIAVDKVRFIIAPQSSVGVLNSAKPNSSPLGLTLQKLNVSNSDFKTL